MIPSAPAITLVVSADAVSLMFLRSKMNIIDRSSILAEITIILYNMLSPAVIAGYDSNNFRIKNFIPFRAVIVR